MTRTERAAIIKKLVKWLVSKEKGQKIRELAIEVNCILKVSPVFDKQEKTVEG